MAKNKYNGAILDKKDLNKFFTSLASKFHIFAPSKKDDGNSFVKVDSFDDIKFDYKNTKISPKGFFFPQTEILFNFNTEKNEIKHEDIKTNKQNLLFGIRPCDAMSISFLDKIFNETNPPDPYYVKKRSNSRIISFACNNPSSTCFCTSVGCGPDSEIGADIVFFKLDGRYLIKSITPAGKEILENIKELLKPVTDNDLKEKERSISAAKNKIKKMFDLNVLPKKLDNFNGSYWEKFYQKCLGCGVCTYLCPTCHCFDITDEVSKSCGRRLRTWDSCMFALFTLHASGHNPRPTQRERIRQRIMHKFNYAPKNYDYTFCVGCGRCIIYCPVNMDIRYLIKEIMEEK